MKSYYKRLGDKTEIEARICKLPIGKYSFETRFSHAKNQRMRKFELNVNMPLFNSEYAAENWIENQGEWE